MTKVNSLNPEVFKKVSSYIRETFYEKQRACSLDDISTNISLSRFKTSEYVQVMAKKKQLHEIYSGNGLPTLYIPGDAIKEMMKLEPKPHWIDKFVFQNKLEILKAIHTRKIEIEKFESFERILYATDKVLEKSLAISLSFIGFEKVVYTEDTQKHDIEFIHNDCLYILEAKGKTGQCDKDDVLQLRGWIDLKLEEGHKAEQLKGVLVVNSHRNVDPVKRGQDPFTEKAKQFLKMNKFIYLSTSFLYEIINDIISGKLDLANAKSKFLGGQEL